MKSWHGIGSFPMGLERGNSIRFRGHAKGWSSGRSTYEDSATKPAREGVTEGRLLKSRCPRADGCWSFRGSAAEYSEAETLSGRGLMKIPGSGETHEVGLIQAVARLLPSLYGVLRRCRQGLSRPGLDPHLSTRPVSSIPPLHIDYAAIGNILYTSWKAPKLITRLVHSDCSDIQYRCRFRSAKLSPGRDPHHHPVYHVPGFWLLQYNLQDLLFGELKNDLQRHFTLRLAQALRSPGKIHMRYGATMAGTSSCTIRPVREARGL